MFKYILMAVSLFAFTAIAHANTPISAFSTNQPNSSTALDHSDWQYFLDTHLNYDEFGQSYFSYQQVTPQELAMLNNYIQRMEKVKPHQLSAIEEKAFWINLYNALTVKVVLDAYPVDSIKDIDGKFGGLFATGPWEKERIMVSGVGLSLNNIEHDIVRPKYNDYRIHFALNCAAKGCPNLSNQVFTASNIEQQLNEAEATFVNHQRGVRFDGRQLVLSKIFDWYLEDFAQNETALIQLIAPKVNATTRARLNGYKGKIKYEYDWSLNEVAQP
ncbi:DUF547 domain-containing protein [Reinekea forsetii]|nr:DUF547 domain-containing protein [Reinekea forsetii]